MKSTTKSERPKVITPFKEYLNASAVAKITYEIHSSSLSIFQSKHASEEWTKSIVQHLDSLELKERVKIISRSIFSLFYPQALIDSELRSPDFIYQQPQLFIQFLDLTHKILAPLEFCRVPLEKDRLSPLERNKIPGLQGFLLWPITQIFEDYSQEILFCDKKLKESQSNINLLEKVFLALQECTIRFTSEFAIRPYLRDAYGETFSFLKRCAADENLHLRRLASEGLRPFLPWGLRVVPSKPIHVKNSFVLLKTLRNDSSLYVRKSVANHLNDLCRVYEDETYTWLEDWSKEKKFLTLNSTSSLTGKKLIHHALRNQLKKGHPRALKILDFSPVPSSSLDFIVKLKKSMNKLGDPIVELSLSIKTPRKLNLKELQSKIRINLQLNFPINSKTKKQKSKLFVLKTLDLSVFKDQKNYSIYKNLSLKDNSTCSYPPGRYSLVVTSNGVTVTHIEFNHQVFNKISPPSPTTRRPL